jgi:hypothetical protein
LIKLGRKNIGGEHPENMGETKMDTLFCPENLKGWQT